MLEAALYSDNAFVTLTYDDEHLPTDGSLNPKHMQLFLKRLRKRVDQQWNKKIRYFGVGEYGDGTDRPHYHLAIFNSPSCLRGQTRLSRTSKPCCDICSLIQSAWPYGHIYLGTLTEQSISYIAGYILKKMTKKDDIRLHGRFPEFSRMSLRPGIGHGMTWEISSTLMASHVDTKLMDVPSSLQHGRSKWPLGRYLRRAVREQIGRTPETPQGVIDEMAAPMFNLQISKRLNKEYISVKDEALKLSEGRRIQIEARAARKAKKVIL